MELTKGEWYWGVQCPKCDATKVIGTAKSPDVEPGENSFQYEIHCEMCGHIETLPARSVQRRQHK